MPTADRLAHLARAGAGRVRQAGPVRAAQLARARRDVRRIPDSDPTLAAVAQALTDAAPDEAPWLAQIDEIRSAYESSDEPVTYTVEDLAWTREYIARYTSPDAPRLVDDSYVERSLGGVTKSTSRPAPWGRVLFRLARRLRPEHAIELGTSVGMSACCLGAALASNGVGRLVTIDAQPSPVSFAQRAFERLGVSARVDARIGTFDDVLGDVLASMGRVDLAFIDGHHSREPTLRYFETLAAAARPGALFVFDDIEEAHPGMEDAWEELRADARVSGAVKVASVGFAVIGGTPAPYAELPVLPVR